MITTTVKPPLPVHTVESQRSELRSFLGSRAMNHNQVYHPRVFFFFHNRSKVYWLRCKVAPKDIWHSAALKRLEECGESLFLSDDYDLVESYIIEYSGLKAFINETTLYCGMYHKLLRQACLRCTYNLPP